MFFLSVLLALIVTAVSAAAPVTATRLDGTVATGELQQFDAGVIAISTGESQTKLAPNELLSLRWSADPKSASSTSLAPLAELTDGTTLPIADIRISGSDATLTLRSGDSSKRELKVPLTKIAALRLQPLAAGTAPQWAEIRGQKFSSDVLVALKRGGQSLDYLEGTLGDVTEDRVEFKVDDQQTRPKRANVAGLIYYRRESNTEKKAICQLRGSDSLAIAAAQVALNGQSLKITTVSGIELEWPLSEIQLADFSAGKIAFLSDMEPLSEKWAPLVGVPAGATFAANYGKPRRDQAPFGGPIVLPQTTTDTSTNPQMHSFAKGLALRSRTETVYRVPSGFSHFVATAGIDPATSADGSVQLRVFGDDRSLVETEIAGNQPPVPIDLNIVGVKRLKIIVDFGQNLDTGDWLDLGDAKLVK